MNEKPGLLSLVLADSIYTDAESGKRIIVGTFNRIWSTKFPIRHTPVSAFIQMTDFNGKAPLQLKVVRLRDNLVVMQSGEIPIECDDPIAVVDIVVRVPALIFPDVGSYAFECYVDGGLIGFVRIAAMLRQIGGSDDEDN